MGQSTPTTTMALDTFEQRYAGYRSELAKREQVWFDELVCRARRHSNAINRRRSRDVRWQGIGGLSCVPLVRFAKRRIAQTLY